MRSVRFLAILAASLAAVSLGWLPAALAAPSADEKATGRPATIEMIVPADAQISFDGAGTSSRGTFRQFVSPPLAPGNLYHYYNVRARWTENGQKFDETTCICVREGDTIRITYPRGAAEESRAYYYSPEPPPARANTYYFGPDRSGRTIRYYSDYPPPPNVKTFSELSPIQGTQYGPG
jgi:uncharacterized protein (TIGR03000 family)